MPGCVCVCVCVCGMCVKDKPIGVDSRKIRINCLTVNENKVNSFECFNPLKINLSLRCELRELMDQLGQGNFV